VDLEKPMLRALTAFPSEIEGRRVLCLSDPEGISESVASLAPEIVPFLFEVLDGEHSLAEIQAEFTRRSGGQLMFREDLVSLLEQLDEALFLQSPRFERHVAKLLEEYRSAPERPAGHAGHAYPDDPDELRAFLDALYEGVEAPPGGGRARAVAVPHLDPRAGGRSAALGLTGLAESFDGESVVVLGVGHQLGRLPYALTEQDYATPRGTVPVDRDLLGRVIDAAGSWLFDEELVHRGEHSVEFAAVFLKHALPDRDLRILPILCGSFHQLLVGGEDPADDPLVGAFLETLAEEAADSLLFACVDLAHMGPHYGDRAPLGSPDLELIEREDRAMLERMADRDQAGFLAHLRECGDRRRVCGLSALYTTLALLPPGPPGRLASYEQPEFPGPGNTVTICAMTWSDPRV